MIEVKHLDKSFGDLHILKDISTNIEKGEKVVIIGPSGSGKSTFLRCLNRLEQLVAEHCGVDIHVAHSYVLQNYNDVLSSDYAQSFYARIAV